MSALIWLLIPIIAAGGIYVGLRVYPIGYLGFLLGLVVVFCAFLVLRDSAPAFLILFVFGLGLVWAHIGTKFRD